MLTLYSGIPVEKLKKNNIIEKQEKGELGAGLPRRGASEA